MPRFRPRDCVLVAAFYAALAVLYTFPLVRDLPGVIPHDLGDPALNTWILWWNAQAVPLTERWWNAPMFFPMTGAFAFSEQLLGVSVFATPLQWFGAHPQTAYNVAFLLSFALSGMAAHLLAYSLSGRHDAAAIAGLSFGFNPYRAAQLAHLQVLSSYWMPIALLALHRYRAHRAWRWLAVFAATWLLQALCSGYYLFYFSVLVGLWLAWFGSGSAHWRGTARVGAAWALTALPLLALLLPVRAIHERHGLSRQIGEIEALSADVTSVLSVSPLLAVWGRWSVEPHAETQLFPGLAVVCLTVGGLLRARRSRPIAAAPMSRTRRTVLAAAGVLGLVTLGAGVFGPWDARLLGLHVSVGRIHKPLTLTLWLVLIVMLSGPRAADLWRRRSLFMFYVAATGTLWLLALGPSPKVLGTEVLYEAPYRWLLKLPGFDAIRVPARFAMPALLCLAVAASLAFARLAPADRRRRAILAVAIALAILAEGWLGRLPLVQRPASGPWAALNSQDSAVLEWPLGYVDRDVTALYRAMDHGRPVINGYSGYAPSFYAPLKLGFDRGDKSIFDPVTRLTPLIMTVDYSADDGGYMRRLVEKRRGVTLIGVEGDRGVYRIPRKGRKPARARGKPVRILRISGSFDPQDPKVIQDGDFTTRWDSGSGQRGTEFVLIELEQVQPVNAVILASGPFMWEYPKNLVVETSLDGAEWIKGRRGMCSGLAYDAAFEQPKEMLVPFVFKRRDARFVRLTQVGVDEKYHWSIAELRVLR